MRKRENVVHSLPTRLCAFLRREAVLSIALLCAALSMLAVPPDAGYAGYIDLRVLCLLACSNAACSRCFPSACCPAGSSFACSTLC